MNRYRPFRLGTIAALLLVPITTAGAAKDGLWLGNDPTGQGPSPAGTNHSSLLFVPNLGQFDSRAEFVIQGSHGAVWFARDAVWIQVRRGTEGTEGTEGTQGTCYSVSLSPCPLVSLSSQGVNLKLTFPGMNPSAYFVPGDRQATQMNYFTGHDPARWQAGVPTYSSLRWAGLYQDVDVVFGSATDGLGITVEAGREADLSALRLQVEGADGLYVDESGRLIADTAMGPVPLPVLQTSTGARLCPLPTGDTVTFSKTQAAPSASSFLSSFSSRYADQPSDFLLYSTYLGGAGFDPGGLGVAVDAAGAAYVAGQTTAGDFPTTPGAFDVNLSGTSDAFITKVSPTGSDLVYSTFVGGSSDDIAYGIVVDGNGAAYIMGSTTSVDLPTTPGAFDPTFNGGTQDMFVAKLNPTGSNLVYSTYLGSSGCDYCNGNDGSPIAVDSLGQVYVTGPAGAGDFPTTPGAIQTTYGGGAADAFVTKLNPTGTGLVYSTFLGGSDMDFGMGVAVNGGGELFVTGNTVSANFPTTPGAFDTTFNGPTGNLGGDAFVARLNPLGTGLMFSTYLGGTGGAGQGDVGSAVAIGPDGLPYITGWAFVNDFPTTPGAFDTTFNGLSDAWIVKMNATGSGLMYSTFIGGSNYDDGFSIVVDAAGNAVYTGWSWSRNYPVTANAYDPTLGGMYDAVVARLSPDGSQLTYGTFIGGAAQDVSYSLAMGPTGAVTIVGSTRSADWPTTPQAYDTSYNGAGDAFVTKVSLPANQMLHVASVDPTYQPSGQRFLVTISFSIQDATNMPVPGARVSAQVMLPSGSRFNFAMTTNVEGIASGSSLTGQHGTYTFCVTNVTKAGWTYDASSNVETCDSVTIP